MQSKHSSLCRNNSEDYSHFLKDFFLKLKSLIVAASTAVVEKPEAETVLPFDLG